MLEPKIAFCDDDISSREIINNLLKKIPNIRISGEYESAEMLIENLRKKNPNIVLFKLQSNKISDLLAIKNILIKNPSIKVIVCSNLEDFRTITFAFNAGAIAFLAKKDLSVKDLTNAIDSSLKNVHFLSKSCEYKMKEIIKMIQLNHSN